MEADTGDLIHTDHKGGGGGGSWRGGGGEDSSSDSRSKDHRGANGGNWMKGNGQDGHNSWKVNWNGGDERRNNGSGNN